jgi:hypothetical protein
VILKKARLGWKKVEKENVDTGKGQYGISPWRRVKFRQELDRTYLRFFSMKFPQIKLRVFSQSSG